MMTPLSLELVGDGMKKLERDLKTVSNRGLFGDLVFRESFVFGDLGGVFGGDDLEDHSKENLGPFWFLLVGEGLWCSGR